jgi:radical SAM superfamily enzyme YgiQ (UPF0313 family)
MRLTLVHPCIGRHAGDARYIRSWQMEPLAPSVLAGMTPSDVSVRFYDDRLERIPYDEPTDLVAISVETYTAVRSYQIASEYRRRGVPVVMGGFHATLCTEEVARYADSVVVGEAESVWQELIDDYRHGVPRAVYRSSTRPALGGTRYDRSIFRGKRYVPVTLVEAGRGCHWRCEFCAVQAYFASTQTRRPIDRILSDIAEARTRRNFFFFVDDNITSNMEQAKEFFRALIPLRIRWVSQASINAAHDEEFLDLIERSGCQGLLVGFESLNERTLRKMRKGFNTMNGGYEVALANLHRHNIRLYATFIFGYDDDTAETFDLAAEFAQHHSFYIAAFNHLTPFPGTPLYARMQKNGQLIYDSWWTDPRYRYNHIPFRPGKLTPRELQQLCIQARAKFYSLPSIARRFCARVNRSNGFMARNFPLINLMLRGEVHQRDELPLGDAGWNRPLIEATRQMPANYAGMARPVLHAV